MDIERMYEEVVAYEKEYGEDKKSLMMKANLFNLIGESDKALNLLFRALKYDDSDYNVLYSISILLEKMEQYPLACVYYAKAAKEMNNQEDIEEYKGIISYFDTLSFEYRSIFDTVLNSTKKNFLFVSSENYSNNSISAEIAKVIFSLGNDVIYVNPEFSANVNYRPSEEELVNYAVHVSEIKNGIEIFTPINAVNYDVRSVNSLVEYIISKIKDAVIIIDNEKILESVIPYKNTNVIIYNYIGNYKNSLDLRLITDISSYIICKDEETFKSICNTKDKNVHLLHEYSASYDPDSKHCTWISESCLIIRIANDLMYECEKTKNLYKSIFDEEYTLKTKTINDIEKEKCIGCMSCLNVCHVGAIKININKLGFSYPEINKNVCVNCGLCYDHCPTVKNVHIGQSASYCYAMMGGDQIRERSSSGGVFSVLAEKFIRDGGYVAGVVFDNDFSVRHIVSNKLSDLRRMCESKYTESKLTDTYSVIKKLLDSGEKVMFTGCPCQSAGLYSFLGKDYINLYSISVVCHGVPSPSLYKEHLNSLCKENADIEEVSFRRKSKFGWNPGFYVRYSDGSEYIGETVSDTYMQGFLNNMILRESCYNCMFRDDFYSDLVIGDFWGIDNIEKISDKKGVSYVSCNTNKGKKLIEENCFKFQKIVEIPKEKAVPYNPSIRYSVSKPLFSEEFFSNLEGMSFDDAYIKTFSDVHFDVVMVVLYSRNYGNAITNYALHKALTSLGLSVMVVDNMLSLNGLIGTPSRQFKDFSERYYDLSSRYFPFGKYDLLVNASDNFIVGSDQVWPSYLSNWINDSGYFHLKFVPDEKNKISYGSSFGQASLASEDNKVSYYSALFKRFDHLSVREKFGVEVLKNKFKVKSKYVLDPVFLPEKADYLELAEKANLKIDKPFIVTYILNPNKNKIAYIRSIAADLGEDIEIYNIIDAEPLAYEKNASEFSEDDNVLFDLSPEEFLWYFANSQFVITDSYHGTCFSIIFEKKFTAFVNRQSDRFKTFKEFKLGYRILESVPDAVPDNMFDDIDYNSIKRMLNDFKEYSVEYLKQSLRIDKK